MVTLVHENGSKESVVEWSLRHYELRHMGYKEVKQKKSGKGYAVNYYNHPTVIMSEQAYKKMSMEDVEHIEEWSNIENPIQELPHLRVIR